MEEYRTLEIQKAFAECTSVALALEMSSAESLAGSDARLHFEPLPFFLRHALPRFE